MGSVVVTPLPNDNRIMLYKATYILLGKLNKDGKTFEENNTSTCRDFLVDTFKRDYRFSYLERLGIRHTKRKESDLIPVGVINKDKTVFGIFSNTKSQKELNRCLNKLLQLLNKFEKSVKWKRTVYHELSIKGTYLKRTSNGLKLVIGSKCWSTNPFFLYIYLAAFKLFTYYHHEKMPSKFIKAIEVAETLQEVFEAAEKHMSTPHYQYSRASRWLKVIRKRVKIFKGFTTNDLCFTKEYTSEGMPILESGMPILESVGIHCLFNIHCRPEIRRIVNSKGVNLLKRIDSYIYHP